MFIENHFNIVKDFDIQDLIQDTLSLSEDDWNLDVSRQSSPNNVHKMTQCYFVNDFPLTWNGKEYPIQRKAPNDIIYNRIKSITDDLEKVFEGRVGRSMLVKLLPRCSIAPHNDIGYYLRSVHRCHIPVVTNDNVIFGLGDLRMNMKVGTCYEIDNKNKHYVENNSDLDRVHLIVDIIPFKAFL